MRNNDNKKLYGLFDDNMYELDIFIGDKNYHNKGYISSKQSVNLGAKMCYNPPHGIIHCQTWNHLMEQDAQDPGKDGHPPR